MANLEKSAVSSEFGVIDSQRFSPRRGCILFLPHLRSLPLSLFSIFLSFSLKSGENLRGGYLSGGNGGDDGETDNRRRVGMFLLAFVFPAAGVSMGRK